MIANGVALAEDGSVILVGSTLYTWNVESTNFPLYGTDLNGESDFAAVRLDENGEEIWSYQVGIVEEREREPVG